MQANDKAECLAPGALAGKTIWITGGGSGVGRAMALRFATLGAKLALSGRRTEPLAATVAAIEAAGGVAAFAPCDVRHSSEVDAAYEKLGATLGPLDALVNNAAGNFLCPAEELSDNAFSAIVDIVLKGTFHCTRTAGRGWIALALVVFAAWRPGRVVLGAFLFGGVTILQLHAQSILLYLL